MQERDTTFASITENVTESAKKIEQDDAVIGDINEHFESHGEELLIQDETLYNYQYLNFIKLNIFLGNLCSLLRILEWTLMHLHYVPIVFLLPPLRFMQEIKRT
jgi:hypothetical protein